MASAGQATAGQVVAASAATAPSVITGNAASPYLAPQSHATAVVKAHRVRLSAVHTVSVRHLRHPHPSNPSTPSPLLTVHRNNPDTGLHLHSLSPTVLTPQPASGTVRPSSTGYGGFAGMNNLVFPGHGPADPSVASGPHGLLTTVNEAVGGSTWTGGVQWLSSLQDWFGLPSTEPVFDPHTLYDPISGRFVFIADDNGKNIDISVSSDNTGLNGWCNIVLPAQNTSSQFADFPLIGLDSFDYYVTVNEYNSSGTVFEGNRVMAINQHDSAACTASTFDSIENVPDPGTGQLAFGFTPALDYSGQNVGYFVDSYHGGGAHVTLGYYDSLAGELHVQQVSVPAYSAAVPAPQKGTSGLLDTVSPPGIYQAINDTHGLYTVLTTKCTSAGKTTDCLQWFEFNAAPGAQNLQSAGLIGPAAGLAFAFPSMGESPNGDAMFNLAVLGTAVYPSSSYVSMNTQHQFGAMYYINQGAGPQTEIPGDCSGCYRWGDFSSDYQDANNSNLFWLADETAANDNTWGTWIAHVGP